MAEEQKPQTIAEEAGLPDNWVPIDAAPIIPSEPPRTGILGDGSSKYAVGSLPPGYQSDKSFVETAAYAARTPQLSLMPLGIQGNPSTNAAIMSTARKAVRIPPAVAAAVTTDIDDGLIHGDAIWETDSAYVFFRDDFMSVTGNISGHGIGELGWELSGNVGGFSTPSNLKGLTVLNTGEFSWSNTTTNNSNPSQGIGALSLGTFNIGPSQPATDVMAWPLLAFPSWKATFIWRFHRTIEIPSGIAPNFSQKSIYIGLANNVDLPTNGWSRPPIFIGARYDTDTTAPAISDTTIKLESVQNALPTGSTPTRDNTQGTVFDTGITPAEDVYYRLDIICTVAGTVTMSINGAAPQTFTLPKIVITAGSANTAVRANNGEALLQFGTIGGLFVTHPFGPGVPVTVAGTGTSPTLDGNYNTNQTYIASTINDRISYLFAPTVGLATPVGWTVTGFASLIPVILFGNDTQAAPVNDNMICIDYFSFVWNPGVGAGTGTPDPTKSRYF